MLAKLLQSCLTLCKPMDYSLPGSSVHGILQVRILEWVTMPSSRGFFWPRDLIHVSYVSCIGKYVLYHQHHLGSSQRNTTQEKKGADYWYTQQNGYTQQNTYAAWKSQIKKIIYCIILVFSFFKWVWLFLFPKYSQSYSTLCNPMDPPVSSVHGIFQARILEWVAISSSRGSSWPRGLTHISCISCIGRQILYHRVTWEAPVFLYITYFT